MEKQKLPNEQTTMILGLTSFIGCCCTSGILGLVLSGIGLYLGKKDEKLLAENPDQYNLGSSNTWKIVNLVSLVLSSVFVIYYVYMKVTGKDVEQQEQLMEMINQFQNK
ncbi:CCC motif membrane protein [Flavobacterium sp.]|jgi:Ni,Fe-hydrogenase I cytochrome b subunit|uniref:CCC motif membrane protein n=1 Tax=Flavobacterium sp. TaxID=239 RepID=UPI00374CF2A6